MHKLALALALGAAATVDVTADDKAWHAANGGSDPMPLLTPVDGGLPRRGRYHVRVRVPVVPPQLALRRLREDRLLRRSLT